MATISYCESLEHCASANMVLDIKIKSKSGIKAVLTKKNKT